ncbi:putative membrane protein [Vibrio parahaemolyticus 970107]|nr:putative membrane protein [Vibrio parahaemolyticus 970107]
MGVTLLGLGLLVVILAPPLFHSWLSVVLESNKSHTSLGG